MAKKRKSRCQEAVTKSQFARAVGISGGRVTQLIDLGLPILKNGRINLAQAARWYRANIDQGMKPAETRPVTHAPNSFQEARRKREWLRLEKEQLAVDKLRGQLIDADEAERAWIEAGIAIRDGVMGLSAGVCNRLPAEWRQELSAVLDDECRKLLTVISADVRNPKGTQG